MASDLPCCVGMQCQALWADDGKHYPAEVLSVFTKDRVELCRVKFLQYDDEVEVRAADLKPLAKPQRPQKQGGSASSSPVPRQQAAAASVSPAASPAAAPAPAAASTASSAAAPKAATTPNAAGPKTPKASPAPAPAPAAASSDLDSQLKRLQVCVCVM